jgi:hypothetical protein
LVIKKVILFLISFLFIFDLSSKANQFFSVEIDSIVLVMNTFDDRKTPKEKANQRYNSLKINECNAVISVKNIINLSVVSYKVNICDKEIIKL